MNKIVLMFLSLLILCSNTYSQTFGGGNGTAVSPYEIYTRQHLEELANFVSATPAWSSNKYFKLMNDITDSVRRSITLFSGDFNGQKYKITLALQSSFSQQGFGLFGELEGANIYDIVVDGYVKGGNKSYVGAICGKVKVSNTQTKISGCINYCDITFTEGCNIAGICGEATGSDVIFLNCINYGNVSVDYVSGVFGGIGGIAGIANAVTISNCINYGYIKTDAGEYIAGIVGYGGYNTNILNCDNYGNITGANYSEAVGGITGCVATYSKVEYCTNSGYISGKIAVGGITGHSHETIIVSYCINIGTIYASDSYAGGISSGFDNQYRNSNGNYSYCINSGLIIGKSNVGGIVGQSLESVSNCLNTGVIICLNNNNTNIGAITGITKTSVIVTNCYYDKQMCIYGGINNADVTSRAVGRMTKEMIGTNLQTLLGTDAWIYTDSLYPQLKALEGKDVSKIAAAPAYLDDINLDYDKHNNIRECFYVYNNNIQWERAFGNVEFLDNGKVLLVGLGNDTMYAGIGNVKKTIPINIKNLCDGLYDVEFIIRADTHRLVAPNRRNFSLPIYIKADDDISGAVIEKLILEIDRNIFYSRRVTNGTMTINLIDSMAEIIIEDIKVPDLKAGVETLLLNIIGHIILSNKDSNSIDLKEAIFTNEYYKPTLIDGYITLKICSEEENRFLINSSSITIKHNPISAGLLEATCKTLEVGNYSLEIVDILGKTDVIKKWYVSEDDEQEFNFNFPVSMYSCGNYFLVLSTPSDKYLKKFIIQR